MKPFLKIAFWLFLALLAVILYASRDSRKSILTERMYDSIRLGLPYDDVRKVIGWDGEETVSSQEVSVYRWKDGDGVIVVTFTNGFVSSKAQNNLTR